MDIQGYAMAFACWLRHCQEIGLTYQDCDWRTPSTRASWAYINSPCVSMKIQSRFNTSVFGVVTDVQQVRLPGFRKDAVDITVTDDEGDVVSMGRDDFRKYWRVV